MGNKKVVITGATGMVGGCARRVYPNIGIPSESVARAMVHAGLYGTEGHENPVLENKAIRSMRHL